MSRTAHAAELLAELVNCRSDQREQEMVTLLAERLKPWGACVTVQEVAPGRPNLIATFVGRDASRCLMLEAHSDTVGGDAPFRSSVHGGRLYGRGACDAKGPMTAMLLGLRDVLERDGGPPVTVHFVSTCNEELGATGAHALVASGFRAEMGVVAEPTELKIIHAHKGALRAKIVVEGVAAHSAEPSRGVNAIYRMRTVLESLETRVVPALARTRHPLLGSPTLSVGMIRGGTQVNVVPAQCEIEVDRRLLPGESPDAVMAEMLAGLDVRWEISGLYPALEESLDGRAARAVAAACERVLGAATFAVAPYATNAGVFHAGGIPCVVFGPGSIVQAHARQEYIELVQVERAAQVYAALIRGR